MTLLTQEEIEDYIKYLDKAKAGDPQVPKIHALFKADKIERCKENFLPFVRQMWTAFIPGDHHARMAEAFEQVANGTLKRLIINMPPRHTKSEFASYLFPAWFLGKYPHKKIIQTAHTAELAVGFGRKVRNLVATEDYQSIFPTKLSSDSKAAGRWNTDKGGDYFAIGVGGAVTGKGADVLIIDDPHSEQEAMQGNPEVYDRVYEWYGSGPRQRLQPGGAIIKREYWKIWDSEVAPYCDYIIQSWDTAFEKNNRADYSAVTTWGIFYKTNADGFEVPNIILLDAFKARMEFPELKAKAFEYYKHWNPDTLIVEKKAAGAPLIYEMRAMGIPVSEYTPSKGNDKIARVNAISDIFASGYVWCPEARWAEEVVEECAAFPNGNNDDLVDSTSQALLRFRQGGFIRLNSDEPDEVKEFRSNRHKGYY